MEIIAGERLIVAGSHRGPVQAMNGAGLPRSWKIAAIHRAAP